MGSQVSEFLFAGRWQGKFTC